MSQSMRRIFNNQLVIYDHNFNLRNKRARIIKTTTKRLGKRKVVRLNTTFTNPACDCASENVSGSGFESPKGQPTTVEHSKDDLISHWYIRVSVNSRYIILSMALPPRGSLRTNSTSPPAFIPIDVPRHKCQQIVSDLNYQLDQFGLGSRPDPNNSRICDPVGRQSSQSSFPFRRSYPGSEIHLM